MVVDSSAIVAIAMLEPGSDPLVQKALSVPCIVASPTLLEAHIVLRSRLGSQATIFLDQLIFKLRAEIVPFGEHHLREACLAFDRYGKGRHPAGLNFGACMSYALAKNSGQPLLYVGDDFPKTDLMSA